MQRLIGSGGTANVYAAHDELLSTTVAVKCLHRRGAAQPYARRRFEREIAMVSSVRHPNVVATRDAGAWRGHRFLVMERLQGEPLTELTRSGPLRVCDALEIALGVSLGAWHAHRHHVLHGDIKPDNVFVCDSQGLGPWPKLLDFGAGVWLHREPHTGVCGDRWQAAGTPAYMAPEQLAGVAVLDVRTDVHAVGLLLFEMLTGRRPFAERARTLQRGPEGHVEPPSPARYRHELDSELCHVVTRAMAVRPRDRYPSMFELAHALAQLRGSCSNAMAAARRAGRAPCCGAAAW